MVKKKKTLLGITRSQNRIRHLLHEKFSLGGKCNKKLNKKQAAEEYAYCFLNYHYQCEDIENVESIKKRNDYQILVDSGVARITAWNRKNGKFPNEDIDFLCDFFECLKFNLFFKDIDDCVEYEKNFLIESLNLLKKHRDFNMVSKNDDKQRYYDLALSAIKFYLTFNSKGYSNDMLSLIDNVKFFLEKYVFPYTHSLYDCSLHDFISDSSILKVPIQYIVSELNVPSSGIEFKKVVMDNKNLQRLMDQVYRLSPKLCREHSEMIETCYIGDYRIGKSNLHFKDYGDLNRFLQLNIFRFEAYNHIAGENGEDLLLQLEKTVIKNWKKLFKGVELALKVHSFQNIKNFEDNKEDYFSEKCIDILEKNILFNAFCDLGIETLRNIIQDYKNAKHAYEIPDVNISDVKEEISKIKEFTNDDVNGNEVLSRLIYEYYQYNNSLN